jgi:5'-nucleotidase
MPAPKSFNRPTAPAPTTRNHRANLISHLCGSVSVWLTVTVIFIAAATTSAQTSAPSPPSRETTITILQLNDVYQIAPVDRGKRGGMARVATIARTVRLASPNTLFLLAGDFISPSLASRMFKGKQMIDALNSAGLDIATLGNHEFDFGSDILRERMKDSRFAYTIANVIDKATGKPFGGASSYIIRELGGVRVAIFGLLLTDTATMSTPGQGVRFDDAVKAGMRVARNLRRQGADLVIALTHLPMQQDKQLAASGDIDLIVGGHEHELLQAVAGGALIVKAGSDARNLGRIDLHLARTGKPRPATRKGRRSRFRLQSLDWQVIPVTDAVTDDAETAAVVAGYEQQLNASLGEVIGRTSVTLDVRAATVRRGESNIGNFIADAYRAALDSDVALVNSGSLRSDATYGPGELTRKDVLSVLPFENAIVKVKLTGAHLKRLLENGVSQAGQEDGRFPQVSGMAFTYDASRAVGSRVTSLAVGGQPVQADKSYTMAVSAYVFGGGDSYDFKGAELVISAEAGPVEPDVVMEAIRKAGTIAPQVEGRIKSASPVGRAFLRRFDPVLREHVWRQKAA